MTGDEFVSVKLGRMSRLVVEQFQEHMRMGKVDGRRQVATRT